MKIHFIHIILVVCTFGFPLKGFSQIEKLDSIISQREKIKNEKEARLNELKKIYEDSKSPVSGLEILDKIYEEYYTYSYDSAMYYADKELRLATESGDDEYKNKALLHKALLNTKGGYYPEAERILTGIDTTTLSKENLNQYYTSLFWLNLYLGDFTKDQSLKPILREKMEESLKGIVDNTQPGTTEYFFNLAERFKISENNRDSAFVYYNKVIEEAPENSKIYASSAYSLAEHYKLKGKYKEYKDWLIKAAISDISTPLKENLALQELAMLLYDEDKGELERSTNYMAVAWDDALFYGNNMRIVDISRKLPYLFPVYLDSIKEKEHRSVMALIIVSVLLLVMIGMFALIHKKNKQLNQQRDELHNQSNNLKALNSQLSDLNENLSVTNQKLIESNDRLHGINIRRENLAKIWIDICAAHLYKMKSYKIMVRQKVKAHLANDLLNNSAFKPIDEEDAQAFLARFDKAFLDLYPDFISEVNGLLKEDSRFVIKTPNTLNTELRICSLIRLGVKDSSEMADLLFASSQTIYNNRTKLRNKAKEKEGFEEKIRELSTGK
ncbi:MAG: hypothetical protein J1F12_08915 [Muribaculaceae bacterium]|nr:hypothetical protein [Muribaculaceae bacterium]